MATSNEAKVCQRLTDFISIVARYNCLERDRNISFIRMWQATSTNVYLTGSVYRREFYSGSMFEGLPRKVCNDSDMLFTLPHWPVVLLKPPSVDSPYHNKDHVIYKPSEGYPAFMTLKVPTGQQYTDPSTGSYSSGIREYVKDIKDVIVEHEEQKILSSSKFVKLNSREGGEISGPADKRLAKPTDKGKGEADFVACLTCPDWPPSASEFLTRPRKHGWPSQSLLDKIEKAGCHVVAVGPHNSPNKEVEWSWALSMAERELTYDIGESMYICMYMLRAIKNAHWVIEKQPNEPSIFSSYFIKTACMWVGEEMSQDKEDIIGLAKHVIDWLLKCYKSKKMPHYIITGANLIGRLRDDQKHFQQAIEWLEDIKQNFIQKLQLSIEYDRQIEVVAEILHHLESSPEKPIAEDLIEVARHELRREGEAYNMMERYEIVKLLEEYCLPIIYTIETAVDEIIQKKSPIKGLSTQQILAFLPTLPPQVIKPGLKDVIKVLSGKAEDIFLPVLREASSLSKAGYEGMTKSFFNKQLGQAFHCIYCQIDKWNIAPLNPKESDLNNKAIKYYQEGLEMIYPNGWSDKGLGGQVLLGLHYYVTKQWTDLEDTLTKLEPLLMEAKESADILKSLLYVTVDPGEPMAKEGNHKSPSPIWDLHAVHRHPVFVGFRLLELMAEQQENTDDECQYRKCKEEVDQLLQSWE